MGFGPHNYAVISQEKLNLPTRLYLILIYMLKDFNEFVVGTYLSTYIFSWIVYHQMYMTYNNIKMPKMYLPAPLKCTLVWIGKTRFLVR